LKIGIGTDEQCLSYKLGLCGCIHINFDSAINYLVAKIDGIVRAGPGAGDGGITGLYGKIVHSPVFGLQAVYLVGIVGSGFFQVVKPQLIIDIQPALGCINPIYGRSKVSLRFEKLVFWNTVYRHDVQKILGT